MKKIIIYILPLVLLLACTDDFEEMNTNPNEPTAVPAEYLLTSAEKSLLWHSHNEWFNGRLGMVYSQYWTQTQYTEEDRYQLRAGVNNDYWAYFYAGRGGSDYGGGLKDLQEIIELNEENPTSASPNQMAVARVLKVWMFQILTDLYGPIPYAEAFKGNEDPSPAYSSQQDIYMDMLQELTEASNQIDVNAASFPSGDLIYDGNMEMWKKFANSLKLRVAIRLADVDASTAGAAISEAVSAGVFESNEDIAMVKWLSSPPNNNPMHDAVIIDAREDFATSKNLIDRLNMYGDPRVKYYANPNEDGEYVGQTYGLTREDAANIPNSAVSLPSDLVARTATTPNVYMDYAEVAFILAEAVERGFISGNAAEHYNKGIEASMQYWAGLAGETIPDETIQNYVTTVAPYDAANWKQSIGVQKWIALYLQNIQGWTEWRRLDFTGVFTLPAGGVLVGDGIPMRRTYPNDEQTLNLENYQKAVEMLGSDELSTKVWWDVN